nr:MAG TPA_asm: hypothetical protein [Bacteriophage sp.]
MGKVVELTNRQAFSMSLPGMLSYYLISPDNVSMLMVVDYASSIGVYQLNEAHNGFTLLRTVSKTINFTMTDCIFYDAMNAIIAVGQDSNNITRMVWFNTTGTMEMLEIDLPASTKKYGKLASINNRLVAVGDSVLVGDPPYLFSFVDYTASDDQDYEYALVPVTGNDEGNYLTVTTTSKFDGVFITDGTSIYKFYADVAYGNFQQTQKVNAHEPFGRKYPVIVSNAATNYMAGSLSGMVLAGDYLKTGKIDRRAIARESDTLLAFLTNKKPKILKDWNGNIWMIAIVDNPSVTYYDGSGMGLMNVSTTFMEVGDATDANDLAAHGFVIPEGS